MAIDFTNSFSNNGLLTDPEYFYQNTVSRDDVANDLLNGLGGNDEAGFDFQSIVDLSVSSQMGGIIQELQSDITNTNIRISALNKLSSTYKDFSSEVLSPLSQGSSLNGTYANTTNSSAVDVTAGSDVSSGVNFKMRVDQLAESESLTSKVFSSESEVLGEGVLSIDLGAYDASGQFKQNGEGYGVTLSIEEGMTLKDLESEINSRSDKVSAKLIDLPEGGVKLAIFSSDTGSDSAINISVSASTDPNNDVLNSLSYSRVSPGQMTLASEAKDAVYSVNGVEFTSKGNEIKDVFGIDISLKQVTAADFNVSTNSNIDGVSGNVEAFVYSYNMVIDEINTLSAAQPGEEGQGALYREPVIEELEVKLEGLRDLISSNSSGFANIGISFEDDGSLHLDNDKLLTALSSDSNIVSKVFSDSMTSSSAGLEVLSYGNNRDDILSGYTENGSYQVEVTQQATKANLAGVSFSSVSFGAGGHTLNLEINGRTIDVDFSEGTYTSAQAASKIAEAIRGEGVAGYKVVSEDDGSISISSTIYGSSESITVVSGGAEFGLSGSASGQDIQGTINGITASGDGTVLTSLLSNDAKGLSVDVTSNGLGIIGSATIERGALSYFQSIHEEIVSDGGVLSEYLESYKTSIDDSNPSSLVADLEAAELREDQLRSKYNAKYSASQQAISIMQNRIDMIDSIFGSDDD